MNRKLFSIVIRVGAVALILSPGPVWSQTEAGKPRFEREILPILSERCLKCHGTDKPAAGLDLRTAASALKGSAQGPVILSGSADKSPLVLRISNRTMPPKGTLQPLSDEQIALIRRWIDSDALSEQPAPAGAAAAPAVSPSPEINAKDRDF